MGHYGSRRDPPRRAGRTIEWSGILISALLGIGGLIVGFVSLHEATKQTGVASESLNASRRPLVVGFSARSFAEQEAIFDRIPIGPEGRRLDYRSEASGSGVENILICLRSTRNCFVPFGSGPVAAGASAISIPLQNVGPGVALIHRVRAYHGKTRGWTDALRTPPLIPSGEVQRYDFDDYSSITMIEVLYSDSPRTTDQTSCVYLTDREVAAVALTHCRVAG